MTSELANEEQILDFWFAGSRRDPSQLGERNRLWFASDPAFDKSIRGRFGATLTAAANGELKRWRLSPQGCLALILVFDQFTRNIHRGTAAAFANDLKAQALCRDAIAQRIDQELDTVERLFFYLPLEHAEDLEAQDKSVERFTHLHQHAPAALRSATAKALEYAIDHQKIIAAFGRFPHRNLVLDRAPSAAEVTWLRDHPSAYGQG